METLALSGPELALLGLSNSKNSDEVTTDEVQGGCGLEREERSRVVRRGKRRSVAWAEFA